VRRGYVKNVLEARKPEMRARGVEKIVETLRGWRRPGARGSRQARTVRTRAAVRVIVRAGK
jgi:hypothetical protein